MRENQQRELQHLYTYEIMDPPLIFPTIFPNQSNQREMPLGSYKRKYIHEVNRLVKIAQEKSIVR